MGNNLVKLDELLQFPTSPFHNDLGEENATSSQLGRIPAHLMRKFNFSSNNHSNGPVDDSLSKMAAANNHQLNGQPEAANRSAYNSSYTFSSSTNHLSYQTAPPGEFPLSVFENVCKLANCSE